MLLIKKYGNRRLYDTCASQYITLEQLAQRIRDGSDVKVVAAKSGEDLTQSVLTQIILDSRGAARLLPVPLLVQLIRLGDDALAEFFSIYVMWALEVYLRFRRGAGAVASLHPLASLSVPFVELLNRRRKRSRAGSPAATSDPPPDPTDEVVSEVAALREELEQLKRELETYRQERE